MANHIGLYLSVGNLSNKPDIRYVSLSTDSFIAYPNKTPFVYDEETYITTIEVFPTGLNQVSVFYQSNLNVGEIQNNSNYITYDGIVTQISAYILRIGNNNFPYIDNGNSGALLYTFPINKVKFIDVSNQGISVNGYTMNCQITLQSSGLNQLDKVFYTTDSASDLTNYANSNPY